MHSLTNVCTVTLDSSHFQYNAPVLFQDAIPWTVGRDFVAGTAKHLAGSLGLTKPGPPTKSKIIHDKQLQVLMPVRILIYISLSQIFHQIF